MISRDDDLLEEFLKELFQEVAHTQDTDPICQQPVNVEIRRECLKVVDIKKEGRKTTPVGDEFVLSDGDTKVTAHFRINKKQGLGSSKELRVGDIIRVNEGTLKTQNGQHTLLVASFKRIHAAKQHNDEEEEKIDTHQKREKDIEEESLRTPPKSCMKKQRCQSEKNTKRISFGEPLGRHRPKSVTPTGHRTSLRRSLDLSSDRSHPPQTEITHNVGASPSPASSHQREERKSMRNSNNSSEQPIPIRTPSVGEGARSEDASESVSSELTFEPRISRRAHAPRVVNPFNLEPLINAYSKREFEFFNCKVVVVESIPIYRPRYKKLKDLYVSDASHPQPMELAIWASQAEEYDYLEPGDVIMLLKVRVKDFQGVRQLEACDWYTKIYHVRGDESVFNYQPFSERATRPTTEASDSRSYFSASQTVPEDEDDSPLQPSNFGNNS